MQPLPARARPQSRSAGLTLALVHGGQDRRVPAAASAPCSTCRVRHLCLRGSVQADDAMPVDEFVLTRLSVHSGEHLIRAGDPFGSLYALRSGFFMSYAVTWSGRSQVTAFPMAGDLTGLDGIGSGTHVQNLIALEAAEVCVLPYAHLQKQIGLSAELHRQLDRIMSREIVREQTLLTLLGTMDGQARVAAFLLSLANRLAARGDSSTRFDLPMSRAEIGSHIGLALATVSRIFSRLHRLGLIRTNGRAVRIVDLQALRAVARDQSVRTESRRGRQIAIVGQTRARADNVVTLPLPR